MRPEDTHSTNEIKLSRKASISIRAYLDRCATNEIAVGIIFRDKRTDYYQPVGISPKAGNS